MRRLASCMMGCLLVTLAACAADPSSSAEASGEDEVVGEESEAIVQSRPFSDSTLCGVLYGDVNYRGKPIVLPPGLGVANLRDYGLNDAVSSLRVFRGCRMRGYIDANYRGDSRPFEVAGSSAFPTRGFNGHDLGFVENEMSSVSCSCDSTVRDNVCGYVYKDSQFLGDALPVAKQEYFHNLNLDGLNWNDQVSSVNVVSNCVLRTWSDADQSGTERDYPRTSRVAQAEGNDERSSIQADLDGPGNCHWENGCTPGSITSPEFVDEFTCFITFKGKSLRRNNGVCVDADNWWNSI